MGDFPSGQRGQTVNLLRFASVVRIHLPPPALQINKDLQCFFLFLYQGSDVRERLCPQFLTIQVNLRFSKLYHSSVCSFRTWYYTEYNMKQGDESNVKQIDGGNC